MLKSQPGGIQPKAEAAGGIINILAIFMSVIRGSFLVRHQRAEEKKNNTTKTSKPLSGV